MTFFFQCFLSLLLCYASIVSVYLSFLKNRYFDSLTIFFVLTLVSFAVFSLWQMYRTVKNKKQLLKRSVLNSLFERLFLRRFSGTDKKKLLFLFAICFLNFSAGFFSVYTQYSRGIHVSEQGQFFLSQEDTMRSSYNQQQPPLDYYFSYFSSELWGINKFSVRFHAMVFYLVLSLILPLMLWFFCSSFWAVALGSFLFSLNHAIRLHSMDGRPLSLALLTGFLFLFFYMSYCRNSESKEQQSLFFSVLSSQYLFVISIGLQPVVFIVTLFLSSFWLLLENRKVIFKKLFLSHVLTAVLVLPFYIKMYSFSQDTYKLKKNFLEEIASYIEHYNISDLFKTYFYPFYEQLNFSFFILIFGLLIIVFSRKKLSDLTVQIGFCLIAFPLLFDFLFSIAIAWDLQFRYYIVYSVFLIFFCALVLNDILKWLGKKKWKVYFFLISAVILFMWNSWNQIITIKKESRFQFPYRDNSVEQVYGYLKKEGKSEDLIIELSLTQPPVYRSKDLSFFNSFFYDPNHSPNFISFYLITTNSPPFFFENDGDNIPYVDWKNLSSEENKKIFFVVNNEREEDKAYSVLSGFMEEQHRIGEFSIFEWAFKTKNREQEYKKFLFHLIEKTSPKYQAALYETLLYYACENKNKDQFIQLLKKYKALEPSLDEFTKFMKLPARFVLKRRAKFFKNMDYCYLEKEQKK